MKSIALKTFCLLLMLGFTGSAFAIGQAGDSRIQVNGQIILAEEGEDTTLIILQLQYYTSDTTIVGGSFTWIESAGFETTITGVTFKNTFPSGGDTVPYVGAGAFFYSDDFDDEFIYSVNAGVDLYLEENFGFNFDVNKGLSDDYEDTILSVGGFYEF